MSATTKSQDPRFKGRSYLEEDALYYAARVDRANEYKQKGLSHKHAWFKAFEEYPRVYVDSTQCASPSSLGDAEDSSQAS